MWSYHKEGWAPKNWCFQAVVLEKTLESPLDCKESKSVNPKGNQPWIFIGRTDAEAETPILWPPDANAYSFKKTLMLGKIEGLKARGEGDGRGRDGWMASPTQWTWVWASSGGWWRTGKPVCCNPWGHKESDTTERLNNLWSYLAEWKAGIYW